VDRRFYRGLENFVAALIADRDVVPGLRESRPFGADPMSDEFRVVFRFLPGPATVSQDVMGRKLSGQIKEELLHETHNAILWRLFLCFMSRFRRELARAMAAGRKPECNGRAAQASAQSHPPAVAVRNASHLNNFRLAPSYKGRRRPMDQTEERRELERKIEQANRIASRINDPTTYQRLRNFVEELRHKLLQRLAARRTTEEIRARARELWELEGRPAGRDLDIWLQAERELTGGGDEESGSDAASKGA
jgi:Protein of unknown function (DUF2934)